MSSVLVLCRVARGCVWIEEEIVVYLLSCLAVFCIVPFYQISVSDVLYGAEQFSARRNKYLSIHLSLLGVDTGGEVISLQSVALTIDKRSSIPVSSTLNDLLGGKVISTFDSQNDLQSGRKKPAL